MRSASSTTSRASLERALTHGFHSYAGRMHPSIARGGIAAFSAPGDTVVDPFCGSGTVLVEAMGLGPAAIGVDASPLGVAIARVRTTLLGEEGRERLVERGRADRRRVGRAGAQAEASRGAALGPPGDRALSRPRASSSCSACASW